MSAQTFPRLERPPIFEPRLPVGPKYPFRFHLSHGWEIPWPDRPATPVDCGFSNCGICGRKQT